MLESIREGVKKPWVKIVVFAIVISFVFAGYFSSAFFSGDPNAVAIINGESIDRNRFQQVYANVKASRADYYNATVKTEEDERNFQENVLQQLIEEKVIEQSVADLGLRLSNQKLREIIQSEPNYQLDGKYSAALAEQTMARAGMTREAFKKYYENQVTREQLVSGLFQTDFALANEVEQSYAYIAQKRSGRGLKIDIATFKQGIEVSDEEITEYYQNNQQNYRVEEKVAVDYLELSVAKLQAQQQPTDEEVETYYQDNLSRYQADEQRQYSHILILSNDDAESAKAKAEAISLRLSQGEDFAVIAKTESDDIPTRESGGDLGVLLEGTLDEPSEEAVKLLTSIGQVTEPVELDFGYQILKLTNLIAGDAQPLEQVKAEIVAELQKQMAEESYYQLSELLKEKSFEFADSLNEAAQATSLEVQTSPMFGRSSQAGIFANEQVKEIAFSDDVMEGLNSETIEVGENHIVVLRINKHQPSEVQPLEKVKASVVAAVTQTKAKQAAETLAMDIVAKLEAKESIDALMNEHKLSWIDLNKVERNNTLLSYSANNQFFKLQQPNADAVVYDVAEDYQGFTLLVLNAVEQGQWINADEATQQQQKLYMANYFSTADFASFKESLRKQASVKRNLNNLAQ
jgi:peptidyl-prolyl cis-trans isomerase D